MKWSWGKSGNATANCPSGVQMSEVESGILLAMPHPIEFFFPFPSNRRLLFDSMGGGSSIIGGPCLGAASWRALPIPASAQSNAAELGVNGFGSFCRDKRILAAGPNPGIYREFNLFPVNGIWLKTCLLCL